MAATSSLPPGFRFHPTDEELVGYYLKKKVAGAKIELEVIPVVDLYKFDPWELPEKSFLPKRDLEWFFFCPRDKKYPNGSRTNRATSSGYWKATGKDRKVVCEPSVVGLRKTLVFYRGRAPGGDRTEWVMHEYRLCEELTRGVISFVGGFALCRIIKRNEHGQKSGNNVAMGKNSSEILRFNEQVTAAVGSNCVEAVPVESPSENGSGTESEPIVIDNNDRRDDGQLYHLPYDYPDVQQRQLGPAFEYGIQTQPTYSLSSHFSNSINGVESSSYYSMDMPLMSPYSTFTTEVPASFNTGCFPPYLNTSSYMEMSLNDGVMAAPRLELESSINATEPQVCRQSSGDCFELANWFADSVW